MTGTVITKTPRTECSAVTDVERRIQLTVDVDLMGSVTTRKHESSKKSGVSAAQRWGEVTDPL